MSYEGHDKFLCPNGHLWIQNCMAYAEPEVCPECGENFVWVTNVDETNGAEDGEDLCPGDVILEIAHKNICICKDCGQTHQKAPVQYFIPTNIGNVLATNIKNCKHKPGCKYLSDYTQNCNCGVIFDINEHIKNNPWLEQ